ncbi:MAG: formate--tetrahydrofolate ligase, partial [Ureaplasma sp.]|nr:formate--tetrahydrofolate ligase [Ureaplasma sp.]
TSMNPTPVGEGKTTTSIGLVDALNKLKIKTIGVLREPSLGPVFGMKGTGSGSNKAKLLPFDKINLHFTGDLHAITSANNLISAIIENEIYHNSNLKINKDKILWKRCIDINDRSLRDIQLNLFTKNNDHIKTSMNITAASDLMALFCLSKNKEDFVQKISNTIVAYNENNQPIKISDLQIEKAIKTIIEDALDPNLVRTLENNPVIVHGGPFANIAHGCSSIISINAGLQLADIVVTEAGFGSDLGLEKFMDITCDVGEFSPNLILLTISLKSILYNAQDVKDKKQQIIKGFQNVKHHIEHAKKYNVNLVVAINHRLEDDNEQLEYLYELLNNEDVKYALSNSWSKGSEGGINLAKVVLEEINKPTHFTPLYNKSENLFEKVDKICKNAYGSLGAKFSDKALEKLKEYENLEDYYVCIAKNPYSLTCDPKILGKPKNFYTTIEDVEINHAAKFIIPITTIIYR